ncbi:MAG: glycosyltransferase family 2 protein [Oligoflexia bacterium]|nr:glycosyltransferase family 2 protein [Oligoflexia bacterium]MBF0365796.1 glycosyltransferase family 2 protein [Oligoflexia bacterium]
MNAENTAKITIIVPCYNEEKNIKLLYQRIMTTFAHNPYNCDFELIFIDDGSSDQSEKIINEHAKKDARVKGIFLSRNFGQQAAITAGINHASGDAVVFMDADLQDPPELILKMIEQWVNGYDVVYARRNKRIKESFFKKMTAAVFYRLLSKLTSINIPIDTGEFRLVSKDVLEALKSMPEKTRFIRGMITWIGFKQTSVYFDREERKIGETKYSLSKMYRLACDGITAFSVAPLKISTYLGLSISFISFVVILYSIYQKLNHNTKLISGWTSIIVTILFMGGIQLISLGIIGEYLSRVFEEVKNRPVYVVRKTTTGSNSIYENAHAHAHTQTQAQANEKNFMLSSQT